MTPTAALLHMALSRPLVVAIVPQLSLREGSGQPPFGALPDRRQPL